MYTYVTPYINKMGGLIVRVVQISLTSRFTPVYESGLKNYYHCSRIKSSRGLLTEIGAVVNKNINLLIHVRLASGREYSSICLYIYLSVCVSSLTLCYLGMFL